MYNVDSCLLICVLWNIFAVLTEFFLDVFDGVPTVKALPDEYTYRIEAKGIARVRVEKDSPIVELLSEEYHWIGYRRTFVWHELSRSFKVFKFLLRKIRGLIKLQAFFQYVTIQYEFLPQEQLSSCGKISK